MTASAGKNSDNTFVIQEIMGRAHNYNRWIYESIAPGMGRRVLDVGSALGNITQFFVDRERVLSIDVEPAYVERLNERFAQHAAYSAHLCDLERDDLAFLRGERLDTATLVNLIEHVEDDAGFLRRVHSVLEPGGRAVLLVPALPAIYGSMDAADRHFRRYLPRTIAATMGTAGFAVEHCRYLNRLGALGWWFNGRVLRREIIPAGQLGLYERLIPALRLLERAVPLPFGQSLAVWGRKVG